MPYLNFPDGTQKYIKDKKPETIAQAKADMQLLLKDEKR